ncbi:MAG: amidohydrolase [Gemmatimonadota bacterium]
MTGSRITRGAGALLAALLLTACGSGAEDDQDAADLVLRGGHVVTMDEVRPEAEAVAIRGHTILAVGTDAEIDAYIGNDTEVIELDGRLVTPGFIEGHGHFMSLGSARMQLDLTTARTWNDIVAMVATAASDAPQGAWITGRGWHQEKWETPPPGAVEGNPVHTELSAASPNNPVILTHASGHAAFANARAMELAGIDGSTVPPAGGEIVKDAEGNPTGLLRENADELVGAARARDESGRPAEDVEAERRRMVELAGAEALSKGITSFQDAGSNFATIDFLKGLEEEGALPIRLYVMVRRESNADMDAHLPDYFMPIEGNDFLTVRSIKRQIDGALGSHGAWLLEPYIDMPTSTGLTLEDPEDIRGTTEVAIKHGFQVNTHAIGDRANREVLDMYEEVFAANPDRTDLRWRIEHAQHMHPEDVQRFADLGVIAAMQGIHATSDGPWVFRRLGAERAENGAYLWRSLLDAGVVIANGTDVPVEDIDPIASFYASVSRRQADGEVFFADQRMTREEALRSYTVANAYAAFEEEHKGKLAPGMLADVVVLSKDIMSIPEEEIPEARVDLTILGGNVVYQREQATAANR